MPVAVDAEITRLNAVRNGSAEQRWARLKQACILKRARLVVVVERADLQRVTFDERVLAVDVGDVDPLVAKPDFGEIDVVKLAVGVFLQHVEIDHVVLIPVRREIAEHSRAEVRVAENEAAEIAGEFLDSHAHRCRIEERRTPALALFAAQEWEHPGRVAQPPFDEGLLDGVETVETRFALASVRTDDAVFARPQEIDVGDAGDLEPPIDRFVRGVTFEHVEREDEAFIGELLPPAAEKLGTAGWVGAYARQGGELSEVEEGFAREIEFHENVVADDRVIAFQDVLIIRVEDAALAEARVFRNADAPAVLDDDEISVFFRAGFSVTVRAGRAERLVLWKLKLRPVALLLFRFLRRLSGQSLGELLRQTPQILGHLLGYLSC